MPDESTTTSSTGTDAADESTVGFTTCHDPQPIPPSRFDCSEASGVITKSVIIEDGNDDPSVLAGVRRVEGSVRVNRTDLTDLDFMGCLEEVTGDVIIFGNDDLTNVDGLWSLVSIGTDFIFSSNDAMADFDGLPNVGTIRGNLVIRDNLSLETITGFHSLISIELNSFFNDLGQEEFYGGNLTIQVNPELRSVDGLGGLLVINGVFAITHNSSLCISSVNCVGSGIMLPDTPPESWSTQANDNGC